MCFYPIFRSELIINLYFRNFNNFYSDMVIIISKGITLFSPYVDKAVAVRYALDDFVVGDLFNTYGFPAYLFRTDDW